jgi:poly[(R)-3-hydroxyalkanoate] polymerase subunit PhaC
VTPSLSPSAVLERVERDVERALQRGRNGLRYAAGTHRPQVGQTPKETVWSRHKTQLWRYRNDDLGFAPPVVIVHSLVSRSYVLDLHPGNSAVAFLLRSGLDVFLLDWGVADETDAGSTLERYADDEIPAAVAAACDAAGSEEVTLLGYCFGGVLSLLAVARHSELPVRNLVLMATPVDFGGLQAITGLVRAGRLDPEDIIDSTGNVPPEVVENAFRLLKPTAEVSQYATMWENLWNDEYMDGYQAMSQWTRDHVPFPGAAFRQTVEQLVRRNALMDGTLELSGIPTDLRQIRCPVLNVVAERDHIVPLPAAEPVPGLVGSDDAEELRLAAGHVGLVAGRAAAKVTLPGIATWITEHSASV